MAALLFTSAFAASESLRVHTINLIIEVFDDNTSFLFTNSRQSYPGLTLTIGWMPEGYILNNYGFENETLWYQYRKSENEFIRIDCASTFGAAISVDTENAEIKDIDINGIQAMLLKKDEDIQIMWTLYDKSEFISLLGTGINEEDIIRVARNLRT